MSLNTLEKTADIRQQPPRSASLPATTLDTRREIARHIDQVLEAMIARPVPGDDDRDRDYIRYLILDIKEMTQFIEVILDKRRRHPSDDFKVLDVGTCLGILPLTLQSMGINVSACDHPQFEAYGEWIEKKGVPYSRFDLFDGELPYASGSFDVITFKQVLEHLPFSAKSTLKSFYRILRPGGLLLISTPNILRLSSVLRLLLRKSIHPPLEHFFESEFPFTGHFREYTLDELKKMLVWSGFEAARSAYDQHNDVMTLLRLKKKLADNLFNRITWKEILIFAVWRPFTFLVPSLSQFIFVEARKPSS